MRVIIFFCISFFVSNFMMSQIKNSMAKIDFVKIKNNNQNEAIYFYENNWKKFREAAISKSYIKSYELLTDESFSNSNFDIILITEYVDENQFSRYEENFESITTSLHPNGPQFLNRKKPSEFRENVYSIKTEIGATNDLSISIKEIQNILNNIASFSKYYMKADFESLANAYCEDGIILPPGADIIKGREAIKKRWILPEGVAVPYHKITPTEINIMGDYAYDIGYYEGKSIRKDKSEVSWKGKYLIVWKKEDGDWKIYADAWNRIN